MSARRAFTVELTEEQIEQIEAHVTWGGYASASEVVAAGVGELPSPFFEGDSSPAWLAFLEGAKETIRRLDAGLEPTYSAEEVHRRRIARRAAEDR